MATNKRHTVLECEVAVALKTAAGIKVTGRRDAESSLSKVEIKWEGFLFSGCDDVLANPLWQHERRRLNRRFPPNGDGLFPPDLTTRSSAPTKSSYRARRLL